MIASLRGKISHVGPVAVTVETPSGVGYEVHVDRVLAASCRVGQEIYLHTYLKVSDQAHDLYGFGTTEAKDFFSLLLTVSGVGPKSAMNILSLGSLPDIRAAIARGDVKYLTAVQGMGKKMAERVVVELKTKLSGRGIDSESTAGPLGEVVDGLVAMGYSAEEARGAVQDLEVADKTSASLLKEALRRLAK